MSTVLFVGLGNMGAPMARNVLAAGHDVYGHDADPEWKSREGLSGLRSLEELGQGQADHIVTMLPTTDVVVDALLSGEQLLDRVRPGGFVVDMTSGSPSAYPRLEAALAGASLALVDAPVSGGVVGAEAGTLSIMAGGSAADIDTVTPLLLSMGGAVHRMGELGAGQVAKLCNQVMVASHLQALMEGFSLAKSAGLDLEVLREVLLGGAAASWMLDVMGPKVIEGDPSAGFTIDLQLKDLKVAHDLAYEQRVPLPGSALALSLYLEAGAHGEGGLGNQALYRVYERLNDRTFHT